MKKLTLLILFVIALMNYSNAQEAKSEFKASGKPFVKVFTNYHSSFTGDEVHNAFEIQRAYFGYGYNMSKKFSGKVTLDVGSPGVGSLDMTAYLKNAYLQYKDDNLAVKFGMIGLSQFAIQEKQWGARYLYKSFQDQHKFGSSADLGVYAAYKIHDMISVDASILNGEGYKSVEVDGVFKYTVGLTLKAIEGLNLRAYYDMMGSENPQQTLSFFAGYSVEKLKIGAEYNQQMNYKIKEDQDRNGLSFYASYDLKKARLFGRFDQLASTTMEGENDPWDFAKDGQAILAGIEFNPVKGITITPNYQLWMPANESDSRNSIYLSCEVKF